MMKKEKYIFRINFKRADETDDDDHWSSKCMKFLHNKLLFMMYLTFKAKIEDFQMTFKSHVDHEKCIL